MSKELILYFFKANVILTLLYIAYYLFFKRETFHSLNRFLLYFILFCSVLLPLINFSSMLSVENETIVQYQIIDDVSLKIDEFIPATNKQAPEIVEQTSYSLSDIILLVYLLSVLFLLYLTLRDLFKISVFGRNQQKVQLGKLKIIDTPGIVTAFSFFKWVFIDKTNLDKNEINKIIEHEYIHYKKLHTIDLIIVQLFVLLLWFNPIIYMLRRSFREVHEYQADKEVSGAQEDKLNYQKLLIKKVELRTSLAMTSNFNSITLKRIKMMSKNNSNKIKLLNLIVMVPIIFLIGISMSSGIQNAIPGSIHAADTIVFIDDSVSTDTMQLMNTTTTSINKATGEIVTTGRMLAVKGPLQYIADTLAIIDGKIALKGDVTITNTSDPKLRRIPRIRPVNNSVCIDSHMVLRKADHPVATVNVVHEGRVYIVTEGAFAYSTAGGTVIMKKDNDEYYGNFIVIQHDEGFQTLYGCLSKIYHEVGDQVMLGQEIGIAGVSDVDARPQVHYEVIKDGRTMLPQDYY